MKRQTVIVIGGWAHDAGHLEPLSRFLAQRRDVRAVSPAELLSIARVRRLEDKENNSPVSPYALALQSVVTGLNAPFCLAGWSMGAVIAIEAVSRLSLAPERIVTLAGTARFCDENGKTGAPPQTARALRLALARDPAGALCGFFRDAAHPRALESDLLDRRIAAALSTGAEALSHGLRYLQETDLRNDLGRVLTPTLALHGCLDRIVPLEAGKFLGESMENCACVAHKNMGHDLIADMNDPVRYRIIRFLEGGSRLAARRGSVMARFSASAETYDRFAIVQKRVADRVASLVSALPPMRRVLELGCGTGLLTKRLAGMLPSAEIHALDVSPGMVRKARARLGHCRRVKWMVEDAARFRRKKPYDLVVSSSALHWIAPVENAFRAARSLLTEDGRLVFGLMIEGTLAELHASRRRVAPGKPVGAALPSEREVLSALTRSGFRILKRETISSRARYSSAGRFLRAIHEQGLTGGPFSHGETLLTRGELRRLASDYNRHYKSGGKGVFAGYRVLYVTAARGGKRE